MRRDQLLDLTRQVKENTEAIKQLRDSLQKIERDQDVLFTMQKAQQETLTSLRKDVKEDIGTMKKELQTDIRELGQRYDEDVREARRLFPARAHLWIEGILAVATLYGLFGHH